MNLIIGAKQHICGDARMAGSNAERTHRGHGFSLVHEADATLRRTATRQTNCAVARNAGRLSEDAAAARRRLLLRPVSGLQTRRAGSADCVLRTRLHPQIRACWGPAL